MPDTFTPEQISQILEEFFRVVGTRQYIGARYVPIFGRKDEDSIEWDNTAPYEPLTIVLYQGNSYTSRQFVPVGVDITNQEFWALTGNYNAQVEMYRRETAAAREIADNALAAANSAQTDIDTLLPKADFSAENTVKKYVDDSVAEVQEDIDTLLPKADFSAENTVKKYVDDSVAEVQDDIDTLLPKADFSAENTVKKYVDDSIAESEAEIQDLQQPVINYGSFEQYANIPFDFSTHYVQATALKNSYLYVMLSTRSSENKSKIIEFDLSDNTVTREYTFTIDIHGNSMTYVSEFDCLFIQYSGRFAIFSIAEWDYKGFVNQQENYTTFASFAVDNTDSTFYVIQNDKSSILKYLYINDKYRLIAWDNIDMYPVIGILQDSFIYDTYFVSVYTIANKQTILRFYNKYNLKYMTSYIFATTEEAQSAFKYNNKIYLVPANGHIYQTDVSNLFTNRLTNPNHAMYAVELSEMEVYTFSNGTNVIRLLRNLPTLNSFFDSFMPYTSATNNDSTFGLIDGFSPSNYRMIISVFLYNGDSCKIIYDLVGNDYQLTNILMYVSGTLHRLQGINNLDTTAIAAFFSNLNIAVNWNVFPTMFGDLRARKTSYQIIDVSSIV